MDTGYPARRFASGGGAVGGAVLRRDIHLCLPPDQAQGGCHGPDPSIFFAVLRALPSYDPKKAAFRTWLYRIADNKVIDARRQSRPVTTPLEEIELPVQEDFVSQIHDRELLERIEGYVSGLSPSLQAVFRLRLCGERSFGEIAAALGQSESAVKSQYYRLLGRIREEFDPHE